MKNDQTRTDVGLGGNLKNRGSVQPFSCRNGVRRGDDLLPTFLLWCFRSGHVGLLDSFGPGIVLGENLSTAKSVDCSFNTM